MTCYAVLLPFLFLFVLFFILPAALIVAWLRACACGLWWCMLRG